MNTHITRRLFARTLLILFVFTFWGCQQENNASLFGPENDSDNSSSSFETNQFGSPASLVKNDFESGKNSNDRGQSEENTIDYKSSKKFIYDCDAKAYQGGTLQINNGSNFHVYDNSFTPPSCITLGDTATITMEVSYDYEVNELIFNFGPHGSVFEPAALIKLYYGEMELTNKAPTLYYIDDSGNYIEEKPNKINRGKRFMYLSVHHFSRYAVAYGN